MAKNKETQNQAAGQLPEQPSANVGASEPVANIEPQMQSQPPQHPPQQQQPEPPQQQQPSQVKVVADPLFVFLADHLVMKLEPAQFGMLFREIAKELGLGQAERLRDRIANVRPQAKGVARLAFEGAAAFLRARENVSKQKSQQPSRELQEQVA